jgi:hypothetical protein
MEFEAHAQAERSPRSNVLRRLDRGDPPLLSVWGPGTLPPRRPLPANRCTGCHFLSIFSDHKPRRAGPEARMPFLGLVMLENPQGERESEIVK